MTISLSPKKIADRLGYSLLLGLLSLGAMTPGASAAFTNTTTNLKGAAGKAGFNTPTVTADTPAAIAGKIIGYALGLLGIVFVCLTIYAGFLWMTAQGNEEQITKAKKMITNAVIGFIIISLAYVITSFVVTNVTTSI